MDSPSKFFLALQSYCPRLSVVLLSYDSRSTLIRQDRTEKFGRVFTHKEQAANFLSIQAERLPILIYPTNGMCTNSRSSTRPYFFLRSSHIRVDLLSYESKPTNKRKQYDWMAEKKLDGHKSATLIVCMSS